MTIKINGVEQPETGIEQLPESGTPERLEALAKLTKGAKAEETRKILVQAIGEAANCIRTADDNVSAWVGDAIEQESEQRASLDSALRELIGELQTAAMELPVHNSRLAKLEGDVRHIHRERDPKFLPSLYSALAEARDTIKPVENDGQAEVRKNGKLLFTFDYTKAESVVSAAQQALRGFGLSVLPVSLTIEGTNPEHGLYSVNRVYRVAHSSGEQDEFVQQWPAVVGGGGRSLEKAVAASSTGSLAYFLRDLLLIPRGSHDDVNSDEEWDGDRRGGARREQRGGARRDEPTIGPSAPPQPGQLSAATRNLLKRISYASRIEDLDKTRAWIEEKRAAAAGGAVLAYSMNELDAIAAAELERREIVEEHLRGWGEDPAPEQPGEPRTAAKEQAAEGGAEPRQARNGSTKKAPPGLR